MRFRSRVLWLLLAVASLGGGYLAVPSPTEAKPPGCGECREGRLVWFVFECSNPLFPNCLECTFCEPG